MSDILIHVYGGTVQNIFRIPQTEDSCKVYVIDYDQETKGKEYEVHAETLESLPRSCEVARDFRKWQNKLEALKKGEARSKDKVLRLLTKFYDTTQEAIGRAKQGHNDMWEKITEAGDAVEDETDLSEWR